MYFPVAFATSGDQSAIPNTGTEVGTVNFPYGYGSNYSQPLATNPDALRVDRLHFNYLMYSMTANWQGLYQTGVVPWITTAENLGVAFDYDANAFVRGQDGKNYFSIVGANDSEPGTDATKWQLFNPAPSAWTVTVTASPVSTLPNQTIVTNAVTLMTIPLPLAPNNGDRFQVSGVSAGGWLISQAAGQQIFFGNTSTTLGVGGSLASTNRYDDITLRYYTALGNWKVVASIGNVTVV